MEVCRYIESASFYREVNIRSCGSHCLLPGFENELGEKPYVLVQAQSYGPTPGTKLYYYSHQSLKFSELKPGRQVKLERGVFYFGKEIAISHALRRQRQLTPTIDVSLHKLEMLRYKKALVQAIHSQVGPELKEHWRENWTQDKPLYFYRQGQSVPVLSLQRASSLILPALDAYMSSSKPQRLSRPRIWFIIATPPFSVDRSFPLASA